MRAAEHDGIYLRDWRPGDETAFVPREDFARERDVLAWDWSQGAPGPTWAVCRPGGEVIGMGGAQLQDDFGWNAWCSLAEVSLRDWPRLVRLAQVVVDELAATHPPAPVRAFVRVGFAPGIRVLVKLGFRPIGDVRLCGAGPYTILRKVA